MNLKHIFETYYNGEPNFMTPKVYGYGYKEITDIHTLIFEKSEGTGLFGTPLYGCSVLVIDKWEKIACKIDLSKAFKSKQEIEEYIKSITVQDCLNADIWEPKPV